LSLPQGSIGPVSWKFIRIQQANGFEYAQVIGWKDVWPHERKDQKHLGRPGANPWQFCKETNDRIIGHACQLLGQVGGLVKALCKREQITHLSAREAYGAEVIGSTKKCNGLKRPRLVWA
jgi:hypothetical protein